MIIMTRSRTSRASHARVTFEPTAIEAEERGEVWARRWVDLGAEDGAPEGAH